jgi:TPR repeat protein
MGSTGKTWSLGKKTRNASAGWFVSTSLLLTFASFFMLFTAAAAQSPALLAKAQAGDSDAQNSLGDFYYAKNTPEDYTQAAIWYRKAADQGDPKAEYSLGISYCWHEGVPQDYSQAYFWLDLAIEGQVDDTNHWLNYAASHMTPAEIAQAQAKVQAWLQSHPKKASS